MIMLSCLNYHTYACICHQTVTAHNRDDNIHKLAVTQLYGIVNFQFSLKNIIFKNLIKVKKITLLIIIYDMCT